MFPDFNIYSSPLLILVLQGIILSLLLFSSALKKQNYSNFILAVLLLITCYHRTTYTIGFMGWYDTYPKTKINYFLIPFTLCVGPLIYLYVKSLADQGYKFSIKDGIHFIPQVVFILYKILLIFFDSNQAGFDESQNGTLMQFDIENLSIIISALFSIQLLIYLILSFKMYNFYRRTLEEEYSNTFKYEMTWIRNFLFLFSFLFVYDIVQSIINAFIYDLHWTQEWWYQFFAEIIVIYLGIKGYFATVEKLPEVDYSPDPKTYNPTSSENESAPQFKAEVEKINNFLIKDDKFKDPNLSLSKLSRLLKYTPAQLSQYINQGTGQNFNDYINAFRVKDVISKLESNKFKHLSILSIAFDSGFNSKATFNRVFKKLSGHSPSYFRK